jgi:RNA polymerase sigma-70 factor (ECF subfamily)
VSGRTDEELVGALQTGDVESLSVLIGRWEQPLHRFVHRMVPRKEDVQDICQETFLRVLNKADRFRSGSRFSTWMYQIALNLCRDKMRRRRRWSLLVADDLEINDEITASSPGGPSDPAVAAERLELGVAVMRALDALPAAQREVLILKEFEGLKFKEIASILGCPESTVKSRMYGGLSGLRDVLARQGITGAER